MYHSAGVDPPTYRRELTFQLRKLTLGISVGLVKAKPAQSYHFDPYSHFSPDHEARKKLNDYDQEHDQDEDFIYKYKICEIRPPSLEKV